MARARKPLPALEWLQPRARLARRVALLSYLGLLVVVGAWHLLFADLHGARPWVVLSIALVPLLLVAPGMLGGSPRAHAWTCFIVNLYFVQGVLAAIDPARTLFGWLEALFSGVLFCAALLYTRWGFQLQRRLAGEA